MSPSSACLNMIKQQLRTNNVLDEQILSMFLAPTRQLFCPPQYQDFVYADTQLPLSHGQVMLTPLEESLILQTAKIKPSDIILEIGTGTGFFSFLLAQLCQKVISVDYFPEFVHQASAHLAELQVKNVECLHQDASVSTEFPYQFDMIITSAGITEVPAHWLTLLKPQGKIFAPIGETTQNAQWLHYEKQQVTGHEFVFQTKVPMLIHQQPPKFIF